MSKTYNPKKIKRLKKHGFIERMKTTGGKRTVQRRRQKGRYRLTV